MNFEDAVQDWESNDGWEFADKGAAWSFFFAEGKRSSQDVISAQCVKMNQYENIIAELRGDATKWREYIARKQQVIGAGMGRNIMRSDDLPDDYEVN